MARKGVTVKKLANEAKLEDDEALIYLWDADIDIDDITDFIPRKRVPQARKALGLASKREMKSVKYWMQRLNMDAADFIDYASDLNINIQAGSMKLPTGSISKLRKRSLKKLARSTSPSKDSNQKPYLLKRFELPKIGHDITPKVISVDEVEGVHKCLAEDFADRDDPISPAGVRDHTLLKSAVFRQETSFGEVLKYSTPEMMAAALTHSLVNNHAFYNGNKRTALVSMLVSLDRNGLVVTCQEKELFRFILKAAQHTIVPNYANDLAEREVAEITQWICRNSKRITKGDRVISWRRCEKILKEYGCNINNEGDKKIITRNIKTKGLIFSRNKQLTTQLSSYSLANELQIGTIKRIRKELKLDNRNGVDTDFFYSKGENKVDDFINKYRKTLNRLARL